MTSGMKPRRLHKLETLGSSTILPADIASGAATHHDSYVSAEDAAVSAAHRLARMGGGSVVSYETSEVISGGPWPVQVRCTALYERKRR